MNHFLKEAVNLPEHSLLLPPCRLFNPLFEPGKPSIKAVPARGGNFEDNEIRVEVSAGFVNRLQPGIEMGKQVYLVDQQYL